MSLKELTAEAHKQAETQPFVKLMFSGNIDPILYAKYLFNQHTIYDILEIHANMHGLLDDLPNIRRSKSIMDDFYELWPEGESLPELFQSTQDYVHHIVTNKDDPKKLTAHIYVRHMGDLFGGQMIAKKVPGSGNFYKFDNADALKTAIRAKLDDSLADEALVCFSFATKLFEELMQ